MPPGNINEYSEAVSVEWSCMPTVFHAWLIAWGCGTQEVVPSMEEAGLLRDALKQLDQPFLVVVVGEFNSGKSTVINALLGTRFLAEGILPTTNKISVLKFRCAPIFLLQPPQVCRLSVVIASELGRLFPWTDSVLPLGTALKS